MKDRWGIEVFQDDDWALRMPDGDVFCVLWYMWRSPFFPLPFTQVLTIRVPDSGVGILSSSLFELREIENYWLVREIYVALILSSVFAVFEARFTSRYLMQNVHKS